MMGTKGFTRAPVIAVVAVVLVVVAVVAVLALATRQRGGLWIVLDGLSPSEQRLARTIDGCAIATAHRAIGDGATLMIMPIGRSPVQLATTPIHTRAGLRQRLDPVAFRKYKAMKREDAAKRIHTLRTAPAPMGSSDLIAAASVAASAFADSSQHKMLTICGDGHQVGSGINLYRDDPTNCRDLLSRVPNELTNLAGVDVIFATPAADEPHPVPVAQENAIERFWKTCWGRTVHARSVTFRFGAGS